MLPQQRSNPVPVHFPPWGITLLESRHAADFRMNEVSWDFLVILYVVGGRGELVAGDQKFHLEMDTVVMVPAGEPYRVVDQAGDPLWLSILCLEQELVLRLQVELEACRCCVPAKAERSEWRNQFRELIAAGESGQAGAIVGFVGAALRLLEALLLANSGRGVSGDARARVQDYVKALGLRFHQALDIDRAASSLGMSRRRFTDLFREETGTSWLRYVHHLRLDHACRLLAETDRPVRAVIFESGFDDPAGFYRAFRQAYQMTPGEWRSTLSRRRAADDR